MAFVPLVVPMPEIHPVIHVQLCTLNHDPVGQRFLPRELVGQRFLASVTPVGPPWRVHLRHVFPGLDQPTIVWGFAVFEWETAEPFYVALGGGPVPLAPWTPLPVGAVIDLPTLRMVHETTILKRPPWQAPV